MPTHTEHAGTASATSLPPLTLAMEHVRLLWQVRTRTEDLLAAVADGRWPGAELTALAGYARAEVLRQASDEETLLFSAATARQVAGLARDHARLRSVAEALDRAAAGEQEMSSGQVAAVARDFITQLERHLRAEENLLASARAARDVPGTVTLGAHPREWYALTDGPVVDLDPLPHDEAVDAAVDRLLRMRRGEQLELRSASDPEPVWRQINELSVNDYRFTVLEDGPPRWRVQVARRESLEPAW